MSIWEERTASEKTFNARQCLRCLLINDDINKIISKTTNNKKYFLWSFCSPARFLADGFDLRLNFVAVSKLAQMRVKSLSISLVKARSVM